VCADERVGLAHARLSVLDVAHGKQPMTNEDGTVVIVFNGEIHNYTALHDQLEGCGHVFRTGSDTEVLVHAYEQWGEQMLGRLNGQFAFAIRDRRTESVFLARDRFGILPLFYAEQAGDLYFASEVKALFASGHVERALDPCGLDEVFTFWAACPPRTLFRGVRALEPGCWARWRDGRLDVRRYYALDFPIVAVEPATAVETLDDVLRSSVHLRLQAEVPVGAYLSGGLDSSVVCALAARSPHELRTFSVGFVYPGFDESAVEQAVAVGLPTRHAVRSISQGDIARVFPDVVRHAETPFLRTAPAPLYLLSQLAREHGIKVVLTGEGSDEVFLGYELFKETMVRLFCLRQPNSASRPRLFDRLYAELAPQGRAGEFWRRFFLNCGSTDDPLFSHMPRFRTAAHVKRFYSDEFRAGLAGFDPLAELRARLPVAFGRWSPLGRASYLEMTTLLSPYLLSTQGDRMAMAHGVEARVPFLDHRLFEFVAGLPARSKLRGLQEKDILRRWATRVLPPAIVRRPKQPYRAPDVPAFFGAEPPEYVAALLEPGSLRRTGIFNPTAVAALVRRCRAGLATRVWESQALVGVLSTELWHRAFLDSGAAAGSAGARRVRGAMSDATLVPA
jgi:asparagine synthase (glutamine-hydrolysing)